MFLEYLSRDPVYFCYVVLIVVVSISLHELAHGWAAIWQGDRTPITTGHMTMNPIVHMGFVSIIMLLLVGIAFGQMPVDPSRFKSRYGDAIVALAGPLMNLLLALIGLCVFGAWVAVGGLATIQEGTVMQANIQRFFWLLGVFNLSLAIFNLLPIPPLDGSAVLATFHPGYRRLIRSVENPTVFIGVLIMVLIVANRSGYGFFALGRAAALWFVNNVWGAGIELG